MDGMNTNQNYDNQNYSQNNSNPEMKSKLAGGLLGIFLGWVGVHNFYLGYTKKAIVQLCLTVGSVVLETVLYIVATVLALIYIGFLIYPIAVLVGFIPVGVGIWGFVEGIMILAGGIKTDAKGIPLKD